MVKPAPRPDEAITAGHRTIGRVEEKSGRHSAYDVYGNPLGAFQTRQDARRAVHVASLGQSLATLSTTSIGVDLQVERRSTR
ncbi:hypothetical protein [Paradevosia shaoguanensis]|uniref:hypothetical protein n=1 Tax=Paradevosia shaoguanensis TaxID=1335043 RepID=UPI003C729E05